MKIMESIDYSVRHIKTAENLLEITSNLSGGKRIFIKCIIELQKSIIFLIDTTLYMENKKYLEKGLDKNSRAKLFFNKVAKKYLEKDDIKTMGTILLIVKKHKESHLVFVRKNKFVIFNSAKCTIFTENDVKNYIKCMRGIILKIFKKTQDINTPLML